MAPDTIAAYTALAVAGVTFIVGIWSASWGTRGEFNKIEKRIIEVEVTHDKKLAQLKQEMIEGIDTSERTLGESMSAVRQKITDVEIWNRDHFVQKDEFRDAISVLRSDVHSLSVRLDRKLDGIDDKLSGLARPPPHPNKGG